MNVNALRNLPRRYRPHMPRGFTSATPAMYQDVRGARFTYFLNDSESAYLATFSVISPRSVARSTACLQGWPRLSVFGNGERSTQSSDAYTPAGRHSFPGTLPARPEQDRRRGRSSLPARLAYRLPWRPIALRDDAAAYLAAVRAPRPR